MSPEPGIDTTLLIAAASNGDKAAESRLFDLLYDDLQRMAQHHLLRSGRDAGHAQSLVHEVYLRMVRGGAVGSADRQHFFALASRVMRQIVIDHARRRCSDKRGRGVDDLPLDALPEPPSPAQRDDLELLQLDAALGRLEQHDAGLSRLVELHFFGGLAFPEMAELLGRPERTLKREWRRARVLLYHDLAVEA